MKNILCIALFGIASFAYSAPIIYTFEGTVTHFESFHQDYDITDFDIVAGETPLKYVFEVDFKAGNHSFTSSAGTWDYFYSDLLSGSVMNGGLTNGDHYGFTWDQAQIGQITSNLSDVRITASGSETPDWRVQDWSIGQQFESTDVACFPGGNEGCAVYAYGEVTLTSLAVTPVNEPSKILLFTVGLLFLFRSARQFVHSHHANQP